MVIRRPSGNDYAQITDLLDRAFAPSIAESGLVRKLRDACKISLELVIASKGRVVAYVCYTKAYDPAKKQIGYHLSPLGVLPEKQRQGLGTRLIRESVKALGKGQPVYVLGDPEYYTKLGFKADGTQKCSFAPEGDHFMVLSAHALPPRDVLYEAEFYEMA